MKEIKINDEKKVMAGNIIYFFGLFLFCEAYLRKAVYGDFNIIVPILLCVPMVIFCAGICSGFSRKVNLFLGGVITFLCCVFLVVEVVYYGIFHTLVAPFSSLSMVGNAVDFKTVLFSYIDERTKLVFFTFIPCAVYAILCFVKCFGKQLPKKIMKNGCILSLMAAFIAIFLLTLQGTGIKSPLYNYFYNSQININVEQLGLTTGVRLDLERVLCTKLTGNATLFQKKINDIDLVSSGEAQREPNMIDYDFEALIEETGNSNIKTMHQYFSEQNPTYKNDYTGMFEGYNLVFITAEAWWKYAVSEELTPTLYNMLNNGFVFENYYTPLWNGSTIGGEFANLTGLIPKESGDFSMVQSGQNGNDMRFTLSRLLEKEDYGVRAFHSYLHHFYIRNLSHPNMGFEWYAYGNGGYEAELDENGNFVWPQSDLKLVSDTIDVYANAESEPFYTNYMSFSGHANYDETNAMSVRHADIVQDLPYSDEAKAYLACNYELELAVSYLVEQLEARGMLDHTLFVIAPDHIPYGYLEMCSELAGQDLENSLEWYHSSLVVWSASMESPVYVDKYCSNIDIFPTVANLMGLEYDSRFLSGKDILSDAEQFVLFPDRSWITGKGIYNSNKDEFTPFNPDEEIPEDYITQISEMVEIKIQMATDIIEYDYYATLP